MATQAQYTAATAAIMLVIANDIKADVPMMFQNEIPQDKLREFAVEAARKAVDAALAMS